MIEITEELLKERPVCMGRIVLEEKEVPLSPNVKSRVVVLLETSSDAPPASNKAFCLDIFLELEEKVTYGDDQCIALVSVSTGFTSFKTTDHVKEVKDALAKLMLKFNAEVYKTDYLISQVMIKLRDDIYLAAR